MSKETIFAGDWLRHLAEQMQNEISAGAAPRVEKIGVRQFVNQFGYHRRVPRIVGEIRNQLEKCGLRTIPDFQYAYIDGDISIELDSPVQEIGHDKNLADLTVHIGTLPAAHSVPVSVKPDDLLVTAITRMRINDYSQLPVMTNERDVKGVVSWQSIGEAYADGRKPETVGECMEKAQEVDTNMMLTDATERVCNHGYVLVRGEENRITGIVTGEDLAAQFKKLAHPFLLIGEIERLLRNLLRRKFTIDELTAASEGNKTINGPDDLSFGGYCRLLENPASWSKLGLEIDRREFIKRLEKIRGIRNEVMHFSPDDDAAENVEVLEKTALFLRKLARSQHTITRPSP